MAAISGGGKLESYLKDLSRKVAKKASVSVGFFEDATYPDGTSVAQVAFWDEFGTKSSPPRPYFRNMIAAKSGEWGDALAALLEANDYDAEKCMALMGEGISGQLRQSIVDTNAPALSQLTLLIRKWKSDNPNEQIGGKIVGELAAKLHEGPQNLGGVSTKPLVETGQMLASVGYHVK